jgi:hypothetical protein
MTITRARRAAMRRLGAAMAMTVMGLCGVLAGAALVVLAVIAHAVRREDRECSLAGEAPGAAARVARCVLGARSDGTAAVVLGDPRSQRGGGPRAGAAGATRQADAVRPT